MTGRLQLEVCVDDIEGLCAATLGGADRIELCSALALDGLTPSPGLIAMAASMPVTVYAMIRPRPGDFIYSTREVDAMKRDIDAVRVAGLAGVVLGASTANGNLNEGVLATLIDHATGLGTTLHRAIDLPRDKLAALEVAIALKFERILTSGGAQTAKDGAQCIADMVQAAGDRIVVMAGSGINADNVVALMKRTGVREIHASCSASIQGNPAAQAMGFIPPVLRRTDPGVVATLGRVARSHDTDSSD